MLLTPCLSSVVRVDCLSFSLTGCRFLKFTGLVAVATASEVAAVFDLAVGSSVPAVVDTVSVVPGVFDEVAEVAEALIVAASADAAAAIAAMLVTAFLIAWVPVATFLMATVAAASDFAPFSDAKT